MIYEFQKKHYGTGRPFLTKNRNDLTGIVHVFFCEKSFSFTSEATFTQANLRAGIVAKNIIPVFDIDNFEDKSSGVSYEKSPLGYEFKSQDGVFKFIFSSIVRHDYAKLLLNYDASNYDVFFADANGNVIIKKSVEALKGFPTSLISVAPMGVGSTKSKSALKIIIQLDESDDFVYSSYVFKPDFNIKKTEVVFCEFSELTLSGNDLTFYLSDAEFGVPIVSLNSSDFTLTDDLTGEATVNNHSESFTGYHKLVLESPSPTIEAVPNSGNADTTDWSDSNADGVANGWNTLPGQPGSAVKSIGTKAGFTGNAQKVYDDGTFIGDIGFISDTISLDVFNTSMFKIEVSSNELIEVILTFSDASTISYSKTPTGVETFSIDIGAKAGLTLASIQVWAESYSYDGSMAFDNLRIETSSFTTGTIALNNINFVGNENY